MTTDWQLESPYQAGYIAGFAGKNEEFDNPYWHSKGPEEKQWLQGFAHGSQSEEFRKEVYEDR
jgi:ribosome modulation factor